MAGIPDCVRQYHASFSIGGNNLDGLAVGCTHDIAGALRLAVRHILRAGQHADNVAFQAQTCDGTHSAEHSARTCHIVLHLAHVVIRLNGNTAAVEGDALAYEGCIGSVTVAVVAQGNEARRVMTALTYCQQCMHASCFHQGFVHNGNFQRQFLPQLQGIFGHGLRCYHVARVIH